MTIVALDRTETPDQVLARVLRERRIANLPVVADDAPKTTKVAFGIHRGKYVCHLPLTYLRWMVREFRPYSNQVHVLAAAVVELRKREALITGTKGAVQ
jgi:uncharacterized protein (DUF3820 family)